MKFRHLMLATVAAVLASQPVVAQTPAQAPAQAPAQTAADPLASPQFGEWGLDLTGMNTSIRPGDDFFQWANGGWLERTEIPADRSRWGNFHVLRALSDARVRDIIETSASSQNPSADQRLIGSFYRSFMDEARLENLGAQPIRDELAEIRNASERGALARLMGRAFTDFHPTLFGGYVSADANDPTRNVVWTSQGGLGLPDRDYYLEDRFAETRAAYQAHIARMLGMIGWDQPEAAAAQVMAFETALAREHWTSAQSRDDTATYNRRSLAELEAQAPGFDWRAYQQAAGFAAQDFTIVAQPTAFAGMARVWSETPVDVLQAWMAFQYANNAAPYLSSAFVEANFDFNGKTLSGQPQNAPRWRRGVDLVNNNINHAVGRLYADRYYTAESRAQMADLIANLRRALEVRIGQFDWMSDPTKQEALTKLSKFGTNIGAPPRWRDFSELQLSDDDLVGNIQRANQLNWTYNLWQLGQPVDREEWTRGPQLVNAWYRPTRNDITFPAAILEPPFFDPDADPAINYGAIGGVIGHEISHGFDDQGRKSDGDGRLRDWWTPDDAARFQVQADRLGAQYEALPMFPDAHINGELTMGENIADLAGLTMALEAYRMSLNGRPAPVINGLTGEQRVFLGWAQVWRSKDREAFARQLLVSDPHAPAFARVNGVVRNMDAWYEAFNIQPGDPMYIPPEQRVRLW
ncbi:M13-type metalloendopeptidase [Brevundimonas sp. 2R-24]|uniref:M13-type metalloendopeptidase n=1 Tax=Peiella sedimenti TaxID=3061083 RepID=A0ABT8SRH4_9CAUL|nr:M13-type metalloendopeptidase [Caulobacteraceae bacterium XZ-24]